MLNTTFFAIRLKNSKGMGLLGISCAFGVE